MSLRLPVLLLLLLLALACSAQFGSALPAGDHQTELRKVQGVLEELKAERQGKTCEFYFSNIKEQSVLYLLFSVYLSEAVPKMFIRMN